MNERIKRTETVTSATEADARKRLAMELRRLADDCDSGAITAIVLVASSREGVDDNRFTATHWTSPAIRLEVCALSAILVGSTITGHLDDLSERVNGNPPFKGKASTGAVSTRCECATCKREREVN